MAFCTKCRTRLTDDEKTCSNCGQKVITNDLPLSDESNNTEKVKITSISSADDCCTENSKVIEGHACNVRNIELFANEKFDGNIQEAIKYLVSNNDGYMLDDFYINDMTDDEKKFAFNYALDVTEKAMGKEQFTRELKKSIDLAMMDLTEAEIQKMKNNPFAEKLKKDFFILLLAFGFVIAMSLTRIPAEVIAVVTSIVVAYLGPNFAKHSKNYRIFKKYKKEMNSTEK